MHRVVGRLLGLSLTAAATVGLVSCDRLGWSELSRRAQLDTVTDMRDVGTALMSWLTDQLSAPSAGQSSLPPVDLRECPPISHAELEALLVPDYIHSLPATDGWGHPYEFRLNVDRLLADRIMVVRSPGRDGTFSGDTYTIGAFEPTARDEDIVWSDGFFIRWPERKREAE